MGYFSELDIELTGQALLARAMTVEDMEREIDFEAEDAPLENAFDSELDREELEALELHAERWDLERGGYL